MPKSEQRSISFAQVLTEEYRALRENTEWAADTEQDLLRKMHDREAPLSALCISGGGIRSATFALGAIQAFAEKGILADFDYLSTVSGGGYIGGWLSAWKQREQGLNKIIPKLKPTAPAPARVQQLSHSKIGPALNRYLDAGRHHRAKHAAQLAGASADTDVRSDDTSAGPGTGQARSNLPSLLRRCDNTICGHGCGRCDSCDWRPLVCLGHLQRDALPAGGRQQESLGIRLCQ